MDLGLYQVDIFTLEGTRRVELVASDEADAIRQCERHYGYSATTPVLIEDAVE